MVRSPFAAYVSGMNSNPHHDPREETSRDRDSSQERDLPRNAGASGERPAAPEEIGIPTGYPERSFESKRFPVTRQPQVRPTQTRTARKPA